MADKKSMVTFGRQFFGYRKQDVNRYIEQRAAAAHQAEEDFRAKLQERTEQADQLRAENARMTALIAESDKKIVAQKNQIDSLTEQLSQSIQALTELKGELDRLDERLSALACDTPAPKASAEPAPVKQTETESAEKEPAEKAKSSKEQDSSAIGAALRSLRKKLLDFLQ